MKTTAFSSIAWSGIGILSTLGSAATIPRYFERELTTRQGLSSARVSAELGPQISRDSSIFGPSNSTLWDQVTARWTTASKPTIQLVVEPSEESDVATIVKYCNENGIEFLALTGGHGIAASLHSFNGIQISTWKLNQINVDPDGKTAWFGGGVNVGNVTEYLWERGYVTTTGGCECVGMMGAGLGGGHGRHEGLYGMIVDNILQLNVVLADGRAITVNSTSYNDLLWGMKGAGHNFGVVTSFQMNIFPAGPPTWHWHSYIWTGDKLEAVFTAINNYHGNGTTPVNAAFEAGDFLVHEDVSTTEPVLFWSFSYRGPADEAEALLTEFNAIPAVTSQMGDVPYNQIAKAQGSSWSSPICAKNQNHITSTAGLQVYNLTAERLIFDGFAAMMVSNPELAAGASMMHEGYSTARVDAIPSDSTAYPFRADHHLMLADVPITSSDQKAAALKWVAEIRDQWNAGQPGRLPDAYTNYASGLETVQQWYGHESWRIERLRALKAKYDPHNAFRFYNPIVGAKHN
ncbi:hypothetical protein GGS24DRAFT_76006 [Hypoxylon argillaceum]|nr:hypothetical protein GGS24DRAFT_76006 [Hypoxylon argillaceum]KAI1148117.1 hypothetical protein F4825DRAFT_113464 [Nemania diffusa]